MIKYELIKKYELLPALDAANLLDEQIIKECIDYFKEVKFKINAAIKESSNSVMLTYAVNRDNYSKICRLYQLLLKLNYDITPPLSTFNNNKEGFHYADYFEHRITIKW